MVKPFCAVIWHGASNKPEVYLEPSQTTTRECFLEKQLKKQLQAIYSFCEKTPLQIIDLFAPL